MLCAGRVPPAGCAVFGSDAQRAAAQVARSVVGGSSTDRTELPSLTKIPQYVFQVAKKSIVGYILTRRSTEGSLFLETGKHFRPQPAVLSLGLAGCTLTFAALYTCNLC